MAQIKKLSGGGTPKTTYGKYTKDGIEYTVDDKFLNEIAHYNTTVANALRSGKNISYNSNTNTVTGLTTDDISHLNESQQKRIGKKGRPFEGRKMRNERDAVSALKDFTPTTQQEQTPERVLDMSKRIALTLDDNDNIVNNAILDRAKARIDALLNYANWDYDTYKLSGTNFADKDAISRYFADRNYINNLKANIESNNLSEQDKIVLKDFGIDLGTETSEEENQEDAALKTRRQNLTNAGITSNAHIDNLGLTLNGDGTFSLGEGVTNPFGNGRIHFTDNWLRGNHQYEALRGGFWWNDRFIPKSLAEDETKWFWKNTEDYRHANRNNQYGTMDIDSMGNTSNPFIAYDDINGFLPGLQNTGKNAQVMTIQDNDNYTVYAYYDNDSERDSWGYIAKPTYVKYNKQTGESEVLDAPVVADQDIKTTYQNYSDRAKGYYEIKFGEGDNAYTLFANPYDRNDLWFFKEGMNQPHQLTPDEVNELINRGVISSNAQNVSGIGSASASALEDYENNRSWWENLWRLQAIPKSAPKYNGERFNRVSRNIFNQIPSHQTGGVFVKRESEGKTEIRKDKVTDPKKPASTKEVNKYISSFGKEGDLTNADKMQLAAIATDVGSLVTAMATGGGNPLAAGIGAAGTLSQFGADISRDGLDLGDAGNLLMGLGFDAMTMVPGLGAVGKIGKMTKVLRKSANLLNTVFLGVGATSALSSLNKIISGEETNLDDWRNIANGLFAVKGINDTVRSFRVTEYKGAKPNVESTKSTDLKKKAVDEAIAKAKNDKDAPEDLTKFGGNDTSWAKDGNVTNYDEAYEALKDSKHIDESKVKAISNSIQIAADKANKTLTNWWNTSWNPLSSNSRFDFTNRQLKTNINWAENPRFTKSAYHVTPYMDRREVINSGFKPSELRTVFHKKGGVIKAFNGLSVPSYSLTGRTYEFGNPKNSWDLLSEEQLKGIIPTHTTSEINADFDRIKSGQTPQINTSLFSNRNYENNPIIRTATSLNINIPQTSKTTEIEVGDKSNVWDRLGQVDWISPTLNLADFIVSSKAINKTNDEQRAAIKAGMLGSQKSMPTEYYPIFNDQGINRMTDERIRQVRQFKPNSSDAGINMAQSLMVNDKVDAINRERDAQISNLIDKFEANNTALKQQYANQRTAIANENKKNWALGESQLHQVDAQEAGQRGQNLKQLLYQIRQDFAASQQLADQQKLAISQQESQIKFDAEINNKYYNQWKAADPNGTIYGDVHTYAATVDPTNYSAIKINALNSIKQAQDRSIWGLFGKPKTLEVTPSITTPIRKQDVVSFNKKGGKMRPTDEQHYLDQQKEITKSLRKLNDNIFKLFQKMMS